MLRLIGLITVIYLLFHWGIAQAVFVLIAAALRALARL